MNEPHCPVCGADNLVLAVDPHDAAWYCRACGHVFAQPAPPCRDDPRRQDDAHRPPNRPPWGNVEQKPR